MKVQGIDFGGSPVVESTLALQGAWGRSVAGESCLPYSAGASHQKNIYVYTVTVKWGNIVNNSLLSVKQLDSEGSVLYIP